MALEKSLDREKTIELKAENKEKRSYLRQLCERLHLDPAKDYSKEETDQLEPSDRKRKFLVEKIDYYERSKKQKLRDKNSSCPTALGKSKTRIRTNHKECYRNQLCFTFGGTERSILCSILLQVLCRR
jgi:hypothetical protein